MKRLLLLSAAFLCAAPAAPAAPPLAIPIPAPPPEVEERLRLEEEQAAFLAEAEEARLREESGTADSGATESAAETEETDSAPTPDAKPVSEPPAAPNPLPPPALPPPAAILPAVAAPAAPAAAAAAPAPAAAASAGDGAPADPGVFRRDPFWPSALSRARKADHDARAAAAKEAAARAAAIEKARQAAIERGEDPDLVELDDPEEVVASAAEKTSSGTFAGAPDEAWDAAEAKLPPRSGYLGGKKPALMLKGVKKPYFEGDELCVTNRGVVFTWRVSKVDFRAYAHELERLQAEPVRHDR